MRKRAVLCILLVLCMLLPCTSCDAMATQDTIVKTRINLLIVLKNNQICYAVPQNGSNNVFYSFNAAAQPIYDIEGKAATAADLTPGMLVTLEFDGYVLETYPAQFSDVSGIWVTGVRANNVEFLTNLISGMFPSTSPEEVERWQVSFEGGYQFLKPNEMRALEFILQEQWTNSGIKVEKDKDTKKTGHILVTAEETRDEDDSVHLTIRVERPDADPIERNIKAAKKDGKWTIV